MTYVTKRLTTQVSRIRSRLNAITYSYVLDNTRQFALPTLQGFTKRDFEWKFSKFEIVNYALHLKDLVTKSSLMMATKIPNRIPMYREPSLLPP